MEYANLKLLHQSAVLLSGLGFALRGAAALRGARWTQGRLAKTLPHVVDTVLLLSALSLAFQLQINPLHTPWLFAKIIFLLLYIGLGMVALRRNLPWGLRATAYGLALLVFLWIVTAALLKNPWGFGALI